jgi:hypothetical protein
VISRAIIDRLGYIRPLNSYCPSVVATTQYSTSRYSRVSTVPAVGRVSRSRFWTLPVSRRDSIRRWFCSSSLASTLRNSPNTGVPMQSPYLAIANKQAQIMTKAATETGFTPESRSRITLPVAAADKLDPWNEIAG